MEKGKLYVTLSNGDLKCVTAEQKELLRIAKMNHPDLEVDNYLFDYNLDKMAHVPAEMNYVVTKSSREDYMYEYFSTKEEADKFRSGWRSQSLPRKLNDREYNEVNRIFLIHNPDKKRVESAKSVGFNIIGRVCL